MALALHVGTSSSLSPVPHRMRMLGQGPDHRPIPLARLSPPNPQTPPPNQGPTHLPVGQHTLVTAIAILGSLRRGTMLVGAVSSVCLEASCTHSLVGTRTLVQRLPAPPPGPTLCLGAGNPAPVPNREIDHQELNLPGQTARTKPLDQRALNRPTNAQALRLVRAATRLQTTGIAVEIRLASRPRITSAATDKAAMIAIARGIEIGIEMVKVRGGTPTVGTIQNSTNYHHPRPGVTSSGLSYLNVFPCTLVVHHSTLTCRHNNELKL